MHWTKFFVEDEPELGNERVRSGFLWLPKAVRGETRWLVHATWRERYVWTRPGKGRDVKAWRGVEWIDEEEQREDRSASATDLDSREEGDAEGVLRGGSYDGVRRTMPREASRIEMRSGDGSRRVQVEAYERADEEDGRLVVEHVGTRTADRTDDEDER